MRANLTAHTHHAANSAGSSCYNCHMPYTTYGLLKTIRSHTVGSPSVTESVETGRPNACNLCHLDKTLAWTAEALESWYRRRGSPLGADEQNVAASLLWLLQGDAGQRAIVAQAMAWPPAQQASGTDWMAPHLAQLLDDPYDAVRFVAARSMRTLPGFSGFTFDFIAPSQSAPRGAAPDHGHLGPHSFPTGASGARTVARRQRQRRDPIGAAAPQAARQSTHPAA